jgi:hypothetical protein
MPTRLLGVFIHFYPLCISGRLQANGQRLTQFDGESSFEHRRLCVQSGWSVER